MHPILTMGGVFNPMRRPHIILIVLVVTEQGQPQLVASPPQHHALEGPRRDENSPLVSIWIRDIDHGVYPMVKFFAATQ